MIEVAARICYAPEMFDDTNAHFHENLVLRYIAFKDLLASGKSGNGAILREATSTASALFHFAEHWKPVHQKSQRDIISLCPEYELIRDIANASKHKQLTSGTPKISSADALYEIIIITEYQDADGKYTESQPVAEVKLDNGDVKDVLELSTIVINFWGNMLVDHGIRKSFTPFPMPHAPGSKMVTRDKLRPFSSEATRGIRWAPKFRVQIFDPATGKSAPPKSPLEGVRLRLFKPVKVEGTAVVKGKEIPIEIELNGKQSSKYLDLTDEEKQSFLVELIQSKQVEVKMLPHL